MTDPMKERSMALAPIEEALKRIRRGEMVLVVDDEDRENEGDLQMAASWVTADALNFMLRWARGLICMPAAPEIIAALELTPMVAPEIAGCDTPFTVPIDHVDGGSGISAADRALTIRRCVDADACPAEFNRPGHVFPLRAQPGGTLDRRGHTESAVDLAILAGLPPVAVTCEVLDDTGEAASFAVLTEFAEHHRIAMVSIDQIAEHKKTSSADARRPAPLLL
ncbi:MAG: 3,4-dihydroxy-2-butanone-4-phosphate synthase [Acidimicrobiia bacterium]|jgi:3,4-dihydroxy 2-butanone 4-phosphate synthase/GTP cyclohydrolase II